MINRWVAWAVFYSCLIGCGGESVCYASCVFDKQCEQERAEVQVAESGESGKIVEATIIEQALCGICRDTLVSGHVMGIKCSPANNVHHSYHIKCMSDLMPCEYGRGAQVASCPMCRAPLPDEALVMVRAWHCFTYHRCQCRESGLRQDAIHAVRENNENSESDNDDFVEDSVEPGAMSMAAWSREIFVVLALVVALSVQQ